MRDTVYLLSLIFLLVSCQTNTPSGNEIVFGDVIGSYEGECVDYNSSTSLWMNREEATLSVIASSTNTAGIKTSCDRIMDLDISVKSASASKIIFEELLGNNSSITMTYFAETDSITIFQIQDGKDDNLVFRGTRK